MLYDIAIVGGGPAGLSAALTARARGKEVCVISNKPQNSPLARSHRVDNYPGLPQASGLEIIDAMHAQAHEAGAHFEYARVITILPTGTPEAPQFAITTSADFIEARTVILAVGVAPAKAYKGEAELLGKGVSYCATCDGNFYRNQTVCVVALSKEAAEEAEFLASIGITVHLVAAEPLSKEAHLSSLAERIANITLHEGKLLEIAGSALGVSSVLIEEKIGTSSEQMQIAVAGVFILRASIAPSSLVSGLETTDGYISTDRQMRTNITGVFAAGDCAGQPLQIAKAAGEGQIAALSAAELLSSS
jgi:thioredoxin reductase (NADPH)